MSSASSSDSDERAKKLVKTVDSHYLGDFDDKTDDTDEATDSDIMGSGEKMSEKALLAALRKSAAKTKKKKTPKKVQGKIKPAKKKKSVQKLTVTELQKHVRGLSTNGKKKVLEALVKK